MDLMMTLLNDQEAVWRKEEEKEGRESLHVKGRMRES